MLESEMQKRFTRWLRYDGGASFRDGSCADICGGDEQWRRSGVRGERLALVHKISDSGIGFKPFDCFVLGIWKNSFFGSLGYVAVGCELKVSRESVKNSPRIVFSQFQVHQTISLLKSDLGASGGFYVLGFCGVGSDGRERLRAFVVHAFAIAMYLMAEGGKRGRSLTLEECEGRAVEAGKHSGACNGRCGCFYEIKI